MDPTIYRQIHLIGVIVLFLGLGGMLSHAGRDQKAPWVYAVLHGLGLLAILVAGFGSQARLELGFPGWLLVKIGVWILLAALPFLVRRGWIPAFLAWLVAAGLGGLAVWLAVLKPF